tara:strand:- start:1070 stop:1711 length:642 start_codon:yes stop_codon:yes gene_type:complete
MIELPVYEITLPVSGKRIEVSPLVVKEEKIIIAARDTGQKSDSYLTFLKILEDKINFPISELNETDLTHLILEVRKYSIGAKIKVSFSCPQTNADIVLELNCDDFKLKGNLKEKTFKESNYAIKLTVPHKKENLASAVEYIETENEKIDFNSMSDDQREDTIDSLPIKMRNEIQAGCNDLFHYEEMIEYTANEIKRKLPLRSAEDFFTLCFAM